jgi:alkanesulfonate monooxygenase SsuD/methylene tetrahydromethanopterin reductase-like flavin-dependent oxidoreductase (luciferase family)
LVTGVIILPQRQTALFAKQAPDVDLCDRAGILPRPKRQIPIWLGGFSEAAFDRAARIADGFLFSGRSQTEAVQIKARIEAKLRELGGDTDAFGFESIQAIQVAETTNGPATLRRGAKMGGATYLW